MRARLDLIQSDLDLARDSADRSAQIRLYQKHVPYLIHILRSQLEPEDDQAEWEETSDALEAEADLEKADPSEAELEAAAEAVAAVLEADQDDSIGEDVVAEPGSPTALAEDAAIAEAAEADNVNVVEDDENDNANVVENDGDPLDALLVDADEGGNMTPETGEDLRTPSDDPSENGEEVEG